MSSTAQSHDRYCIWAKSTGKSAWVRPTFEGQEKNSIFLPNGQSLIELIEQSTSTTELPTMGLNFEKAGTLGDLVWATGTYACIVSDRFLEVLATVQDYGYTTVPLGQVATRSKYADQRSFNMLFVETTDPDAHLQQIQPGQRSSAWLNVSQSLYEELLNQGLEGIARYEDLDDFLNGR